MKRVFKCHKCGQEIEIEADYFVPGVSGQLVDTNGVLCTFIDPTNDHLCDICLYFSLRDSLPNLLGDEKAKEVLAEHDRRMQVLIEERFGDIRV